MNNRIIQVANICKDISKRHNPIPGRVYFAKGISPAITTCGGGVESAHVCDFNRVIKQYVLGRTNHGKNGNTSNFHVNSYFGCVTAAQRNNRESWIVIIKE